MRTQTTVSNGIRQHRALLSRPDQKPAEPAHRNAAHTHRVTLEGGRCTGVVYEQGGRMVEGPPAER